MAEAVTKKKKSKDSEKDEGKKSSRKKDVDATSSKRSSSPKKERRSSPKKESRDRSVERNLIPKAAAGSSDFEAGVIFNRFDKAQRGVLTAEEFCQIWREGKTADPRKTDGLANVILPDAPIKNPATIGAFTSFEAGRIFSKFDANGDGKIDKSVFESLLRNHPDLLKSHYNNESSTVKTLTPVSEKKYLLPTEVITGRLLTHYDETAGVALPYSAVEQHKMLGNTVLPLSESYRARYDRLRSLLTGKLFPRREHLLQLRRQLQNCSAEVEAARKGIERETLSDSEQIFERLRSVEAMRQSSIKHQVLQLEVELETIERVVRRIELANTDTSETYQPSTGVLITSAAPGSAPLEGIRAPQAASMVEVIQQFSDLSAGIEKLATKSLTVQTDFPTGDFPRETAERLEILAKCDQYMLAVSVKDHMLWTVIKDKERQEELLEDERKLSHEYAQEMAQWAEVSQSLKQQVCVLKQEKEKLERTNYDLINVLRDNNVFYVISEKD